MGLLAFSPFPPLFLRSLVTRNNIYSKKGKRFLLTMSKDWSSESFQSLKYSVFIVINWMTNIYVDFPTLKGSECRVILLKFMKICVIYPIENNPLPLLSSFFFQNPMNHNPSKDTMKMIIPIFLSPSLSSFKIQQITDFPSFP